MSQNQKPKKHWFIRLISWLNPEPWGEWNGKTKDGKRDWALGIKFNPKWKGDDGDS